MSEYQDTLNRMADLQELATNVDSTSQALTANKEKIMALIGDANKQIQKLQGNIDKIKSQGTQAKAEVKELIASADTRQKAALAKLNEKIKAMGDVSSLESQVNLLKKDIDGLADKVGVDDADSDDEGSSASAAQSTLDPTAPEFVSGQGATTGGYTYGKHTRRRRRRHHKKNGKKSHKKRRHSKKHAKRHHRK